MSYKCNKCGEWYIHCNSSKTNKKLLKEREKWRLLCIDITTTNNKLIALIHENKRKLKELQKLNNETIDLS